MAREEDVQRFLEAWTKSWTSAASEQRLLHRNGGILYPGESEPYSPDEQGRRTDQLRLIAPDLDMRLLSWAERDDVLLAEWELSCTLAGRALKFVGVNRFNLKGDRALAGRAFIDRLELLEFLDPEREVLPLGALLTAAFRTADDS